MWRLRAALSLRVRYLSAAPREKIKLTFIGKVDERIAVEAFVGDTLLDVAQLNALDVEGFKLSLSQAVPYQIVI